MGRGGRAEKGLGKMREAVIIRLASEDKEGEEWGERLRRRI